MFKDMKMSEELAQEFRSKPSCQALSVDITVKVLTSGHWPNDSKEQAPALGNLPHEISLAMASFTQFYFSKYNQGRQLNWKLSLGSAELRGNFGAKQRYEFQTSSYQMFLLLLFNDHEVMTYQ